MKNKSEHYKIPKQAFCEKCRHMKKYSLTKLTRNKKIKELELSFEEIVPYCNSCGSEVFVSEIRDLNLDNLEEEYNKAKIYYDEEKDVSYRICSCGRRNDLQGTYEYGLYFECECEESPMKSVKTTSTPTNDTNNVI